MNKKFLVALSMMLLVAVAGVFAQASSVPEEQAVEQAASNSGAIKYVAAALAVGIACIGGGSAVGKSVQLLWAQ